jgi:hypothetical protein
MDLRLGRLRLGELLAGAGGVLLVVLMLAVHWYGARTGWQVLTGARWLALVTVLAALLLVFTQATRPGPALPVTLSVIVFVLGLPTVAWLVYRVAISPAAREHAGGWLGLVSACLIVLGAFLSMRQEGIAQADEPGEIVTVRLRSDRAAQR